MQKQIRLEKVRSYKTLAALEKGVEKFGLSGYRYIVVKTEEGRYTGVFLVSEVLRKEGGYVGHTSQAGFMSV